jgi:exo-1,4-beta-D-glucosaminidase
VYSGGSYTWQDAAFYYQKVNEGKDWVFKDETGVPSQPTFQTLKDNIPDLRPDPKLPYPLNNMWGYHDACSGNGHYEIYYKAMADRYGKPTTLKEFSDRMQLVNADSYRGIFESVGHKLNETGGVMLWKLNAAFPSVVWQIYDWYLEPNAGFYHMRTSLETLHVQLNLDDSTVALVNRGYDASPTLQAEAILYDQKGKESFRKVEDIGPSVTGARSLFSIATELAKADGLRYIVLSLRDGKKLVSQNTYWLHPKHDFTGMKELPLAAVTMQVASASKDDIQQRWKIRFTNSGKSLAFFLHPRFLQNGQEIRPSFWSANYFSILPGQDREVEIAIPARLLKGGKLTVVTEGMNSPAATLLVQK